MLRFGDAEGPLRLLKRAMRELEVSNSKLGPRPVATCAVEELGTDGAVIPRTEFANGSTPLYPSGACLVSFPSLEGGGSYEEAEDSVRAYPLLESDIGAFRRRTFLVFPDLLTCTVVFPDELPKPMPRPVSVFSDEVDSLWVGPVLTVPWLLLAGMPEGAGSLEDDASAFAFLLLAKKDDDEDCVGIFGVLEVLDVIDPLRDFSTCILGTLSSLSGCLTRKPNVPLEAIVAVGFALHVGGLYWYWTWAIRTLAGRHHQKMHWIIHVRRSL